MPEARDVLIVTTSHEAGTFEEFKAHPPAGEPAVELGRGIAIERLPQDEAEAYMDACEPRGMDPPAARQFGQRYALVRHNAPDADQLTWDPDGAILAAVALSRLVRSNPTGAEYAVRVIDYEGGDQHLVPLSFEGRFATYVADLTARDWLDQPEAEALRELLTSYWWDEDELQERVRHALWLSEYGSRVRFVDIAWPHAVTALEALLNTDRHRLRQQFVIRASALAAELGLANIDSPFLDAAYTVRSEGVHGTRVPFHADPTAAERLGRLQRLLQLALRRAIEDAAFRSIFESAASVHSRWRVTTASKRTDTSQ